MPFRPAACLARPKGAGAQLLLISLLHRLGASIEQIRATSPPCATGPDIAQAIRAGRADCGLASRSVASAAGREFVLATWERFDLVMRLRSYFHPPLQALLSFLRTSPFSQRAEELGGNNVSDAGTVRHAP